MQRKAEKALSAKRLKLLLFVDSLLILGYLAESNS